LQRSKNLIVDPNDDGTSALNVVLGKSGAQAAANVKSLQAAASGRMLSSTAISARHAAPGAHIDARRRVIGDPRTLYGRGGGVFGLAKLSDSLMDAWMADPALNANAAVAKWHESQQKFGFKFLVTQLLGYLTGGPQRYTGVPMEVAHKHLAITDAQWDSFIADATLVFQKLGVDAGTQTELLAILSSFHDQCVLPRGQPTPEDPGKCRARPEGNLAYSQLGGVYPLALFADRLVDSVLQDDRVQVQWNSVEDPSGTRHPPGLKYMVTELLCHAAGGPELPTSKGFDDAKLGVDPNEWSAFLQIVTETATIWPTRHHRELIVKICERSKAEICFGLEGHDMPNLELAASSGIDGVAAAMPTSRCPFSGNSGGQCPFSGASQPPQNSTAAPVTPPQNSTAAGNPSMHRAENSVHAPMAGRILGSALQKKLDGLTEEDPDLCCPVSLMVLSNPVIASDGFIYDQSSLVQLLANRLASPMTREVLKKEYQVAEQKKIEVTSFRKLRTKELLDFAREAVTEQQGHLALVALKRVSEYVEALSSLDTSAAQNLCAEAAGLFHQLGHSVPEALQEVLRHSNSSEQPTNKKQRSIITSLSNLAMSSIGTA
jgi:hemoglobin